MSGEEFNREQQIAYLSGKYDMSRDDIDELLSVVPLNDIEALLDLGEQVATSGTDYLYDGGAAQAVSGDEIDYRILANLYQISKKRASDGPDEGWEEVAEQIVDEALSADAGGVGKRNERWQLLEVAMKGSRDNSIDLVEE